MMQGEERRGMSAACVYGTQASLPASASFQAGRRPNKGYAVREQYLSDEESGLTTAIRDSLKSLFAEPRLPDNPYYYLANVLGAYVDRTPLWKEADATILSAIDMEGGVEVGDGALKLCKLAAFGQAWGLPHVLRLVSKEGVRVLHDLLTNSLPDSFFPGPMPSATGDGYAVQVLASIQGTCASWRPQWLEFPELDVRADVLVKGQRVEEAIGHFLSLIQSDMKELDGVPVYFVEGLLITESNGSKLEQCASRAQGVGGSAVSSWTLEDIAARPDDWRKAGMRAVLSGKVLTCRAIVLLEAPEDAKNHDKRRLRFEMAIKTYHFHFQSTPDPSIPINTRTLLVAEAVSHYGCGAPHEALYEGYFLEPSAAKQYCLMFSGSGARANAAAAREPYGRQSLEANMEQLMSLIELDMVKGDDLEAFRRLLHLVMLQDPLPLQPGVLHQGLLLPLEELIVDPSRMSERDMMLSSLPNLCRVLNCGAAVITGVVREVEALTVAFKKWPDKQAKMLAAAASAAAAGSSASDMEAQQMLQLPSFRKARGELVSTPPQLSLDVSLPQGRRASLGAERRRSGAGDAAAGHPDNTEAVYDNEMNSPRSTLRWLLTFNMEERLLQQLLQLGPRISDATGAGIFSGISTILARMVQYLPTTLPQGRSACAELMQAVLPQLEALQPLLQAAGLTLADGLLDRCRDVLWTLHRFDIHVMENAMARVSAGGGDGAGGGGDDEWVVPEWVLNVQSVTDAQVRAGEVAERVAVEGVMLQYCVDSKLDELLAAVWQHLTEPPLSANPFPRLLTFLRARAAKLELWKEDMDETFEHMMTSLSLLQPPMFIYGASPPGDGSPRRTNRIGRGRAGANHVEDEEGVQVFGSYAAVTLADCKALQTLRASLGTMLADRHWQQGAYSVEVVPALIGDAPFTAALKLDDADDALVPAKGRHEGSAARPPFEHPRFFWVECEDHHLVTGPHKREAAALFAAGVVKQTVLLHKSSMHLLMQLEVSQQQDGQSSDADTHVYGADVFAAEDETHQDIVHQIIEAVKTSPEGTTVGRLQVLVAVKEGWYVRMTKHLVFQHNDVVAPLRTGGPATAAHRSGTAAHGPGGAAAAAEPYWGRQVYRRVFLLEPHAQMWLAWNKERGDPAQPYHYSHMVQHAAKEIEALEASGDYFAAQRLLLLSSLACQDAEALFHFSHALHSAAQELWCLQVINRTLVDLLSDTNPPGHFAKLDNERARRLFLVYNTRMRRALMSPKYCYFSGFAAAAPQVLAELKDAVLTSFRLNAAQVRLMERLNVWTQCCEFSVAASIHDCFDQQLKQRVMRGPGSNSLHVESTE